MDGKQAHLIREKQSQDATLFSGPAPGSLDRNRSNRTIDGTSRASQSQWGLPSPERTNVRSFLREARMDPILVTGGTGTLGHHVVRRLSNAGHDIRVLTRGTRPDERAVR